MLTVSRACAYAHLPRTDSIPYRTTARCLRMLILIFPCVTLLLKGPAQDGVTNAFLTLHTRKVLNLL